MKIYRFAFWTVLWIWIWCISVVDHFPMSWSINYTFYVVQNALLPSPISLKNTKQYTEIDLIAKTKNIHSRCRSITCSKSVCSVLAVVSTLIMRVIMFVHLIETWCTRSRHYLKEQIHKNDIQNLSWNTWLQINYHIDKIMNFISAFQKWQVCMQLAASIEWLIPRQSCFVCSSYNIDLLYWKSTLCKIYSCIWKNSLWVLCVQCQPSCFLVCILWWCCYYHPQKSLPQKIFSPQVSP